MKCAKPVNDTLMTINPILCMSFMHVHSCIYTMDQWTLYNPVKHWTNLSYLIHFKAMDLRNVTSIVFTNSIPRIKMKDLTLIDMTPK